MEIIFSPEALKDLEYWRKSGNKKVIEKIKNLLEEIQLRHLMALENPKH